jgi:hydroxypyruvate reductase/glycerate 2-kinase
LIGNHPGITILCAGTDGTDGTTDAAGVLVDSETFAKAISKRIDPETYIREFDSYHFFKKTGGQKVTGPTMKCDVFKSFDFDPMEGAIITSRVSFS